MLPKCQFLCPKCAFTDVLLIMLVLCSMFLPSYYKCAKYHRATFLRIKIFKDFMDIYTTSKIFIHKKFYTNIRINGTSAYPQKFVHKNFNLRQISGNLQNFISSKMLHYSNMLAYNYWAQGLKGNNVNKLYIHMCIITCGK